MFNQPTLLLPAHEPTTTEPAQILAFPSAKVSDYGHPMTIDITMDLGGQSEEHTLQLEFNGHTKALYSSGSSEDSRWFYWDGKQVTLIEGELDYGDMVAEC